MLCSLAGDAEPGLNLGPGIANGSKSIDGLLDGVVDVVGQADQVGQTRIADCDAAAVGAQDAPGKAAYSELSVTGRRRFGVKTSSTLFPAGLGRVCPWLGCPELAVMASPGLVASHLVGFTR